MEQIIEQGEALNYPHIIMHDSSKGTLIVPHIPSPTGIGRRILSMLGGNVHLNFTDTIITCKDMAGSELLFDILYNNVTWRECDKIDSSEKKRVASGICPYCAINSATVYRSCFSNNSTFGTCEECCGLGAKVRRHERMQKVLVSDKSFEYAFFPSEMCNTYFCKHLKIYVKENMVHTHLKQVHDYAKSMCISKAVAKNIKFVDCSKCKVKCEKVNKIKKEYFCDACISEYRSFRGKSPSMDSVKKGRTYGVELEINDIKGISLLCDDLRQCETPCEIGFWTDGSVHDGFEIVTQPSTKSDVLKTAHSICEAVKQYPHTYRSSGLHVHVKDSSAKTNRVFRVWLAMENFVYSVLPESRQKNSFCHRFNVKEWDTLHKSTMYGQDCYDFQKNYDGKYTSINLCNIYGGDNSSDSCEGDCGRCEDCYDNCVYSGCDECDGCECAHDDNSDGGEHGTIEFRCHHATADYKTIKHFVTLIDRVVDFSSNKNDDHKKLFTLSQNPIANCSKICKLLNFPKRTAAFFDQKQKFLMTPIEERKISMDKYDRIEYASEFKTEEQNSVLALMTE